jgi:hypothetical protein
MITVVMSIDYVFYGLFSRGFNFRQHLGHATWEVAVDHQNEVLEDNPTLIAVPFVQIALMEIDVGGDLLYYTNFVFSKQ